MSTSNESSAMEKSSILREIADLDIKAPINVTISFEDDFDDTLIKKEIVSDDYQEDTQETVVSAFFPISEPKTETQTQAFAPCLLNDKQEDKFAVQNSFQDASATQPNLNEKLSNTDTSRKRKTEHLQMCKPKQVKTTSDTSDGNNCGDSSLAFTSLNNANKIQIDPKCSTSEFGNNQSVATSLVASGLSNKELIDSKTDSSSPVNGLCESEKQKISSTITNCLASLSENMRRVLEAYVAHKQQRIPKDVFMKIKKQYFSLSYKTLVIMLLPEENNNNFVSTFLNDSLQRARKKCGPYYVATYDDYASLLYEMLTWTKQCRQHCQSAHISVNSNEKSETPIENGATLRLEVNQDSAQNKRHDNSNIKIATDKICIFTSGPPERSLSINIDPNLQKCLQQTSQNISLETNQWLSETTENGLHNTENYNTTTQPKAAIECLTGFVTNSSRLSTTSQHRPPVIQPTASVIPNRVTTHLEKNQTTVLSDTQTMSSISNYRIPTQQKTALQKQLEMPPSLGYLKQVETQRSPPTYQQSLYFKSQPNRLQQATLPYDQSRHLQAQALPQQQMPSQHNVPLIAHTPSNAAQFQQSQYLQPPSASHQTGQLQSQIDHSHGPMAQYNQSRQAHVGLVQQNQYQRHLQQQPTEHWPTMEELLFTESTLPLPHQSNYVKEGSSRQWQSRQPQQLQLPQAFETEWQDHQGQVPQTQKGSPRAASTDSGFISPLNFNMPTDQTRPDQTMPTTPQEPSGPTMPMIVHVTSLSDKAAFVEMGKCVVCEKSTKQMCMGCMKIYYCNYQCQSLNWAAHAPYCS